VEPDSIASHHVGFVLIPVHIGEHAACAQAKPAGADDREQKPRCQHDRPLCAMPVAHGARACQIRAAFGAACRPLRLTNEIEPTPPAQRMVIDAPASPADCDQRRARRGEDDKEQNSGVRHTALSG
jgi:hypothetical protein